MRWRSFTARASFHLSHRSAAGPASFGSTSRSSGSAIRRRPATSGRPPPIRFRHRLSMIPGPIQELAEKLDDLTAAGCEIEHDWRIARERRSAWKLTSETYLDLKAATDTPERRDNLHAQIAAAFSPLLRDGVLGPDTLPPNEESSRLLSIRKVGEPATAARSGTARSRGAGTNRQARRAGLPRVLLGLYLAANRPDSLRLDRRSTG